MLRMNLLLLLAILPIIALGADNGTDLRSVTVSGSSQIKAEPDMATVRLGVEERRPELEDARSAVNGVVSRFLKLTEDMGIPDERVSTAAAFINPDYEWHPQTRERKLLGYVVSRQLVVDLRDLDQLGPLIEAALEVGVNQVSPPEFSTSRRDEIEKRALAEAAVDARGRAAIVADALGMALGPVRDIQAHGRPQPVFRGAARMEVAAADAGAQTYQPGEIIISASVTAAFDLDLP